MTFVLETWQPWDGERYRVELWRQETTDREARWSSDELRLQGASEIRFSLPRAWLPAGRYQLRLFGLQRLRVQSQRRLRVVALQCQKCQVVERDGAIDAGQSC